MMLDPVKIKTEVSTGNLTFTVADGIIYCADRYGTVVEVGKDAD